MQASQPVFFHSCPKCKWLFTEVQHSHVDTSRTGCKAFYSVVDVYLCRGEESRVGSVLYRYGDEPAEYVSYPLEVLLQLAARDILGNMGQQYAVPSTRIEAG